MLLLSSLRLMLVLMFLGIAASLASATATVTLSWDAPTTNADGSALTDLAGYRLYYGTTPGSRSTMLPAGIATQVIVSGLTDGQTYYLTVTAYDTSQNESVGSSEISYTVPVPPDDTIPPTVVQSSVVEGATNVDPTSTLTVQFSEAMNAATINGGTVQLRDAQGNLIAASVTYNASTNTVSLDPSDTLAPSTTYTFTLNGLTDQAGNALAPVTLDFTTAAEPPPPPLGLIAAYNCNAGSGSILTDNSGHGHDGTLRGATWTSLGKYGHALTFDGVNDRVTIPDQSDLDLTTGMTLMAWVYPTITMTGWRTILQKGPLAYYLHANSDQNRPAFGVTIDSERILYGTTRLARNQWTDLASTYDGVRQRLYVNGVQVGSRAQSGRVQVTTGALEIGGNSRYGEWFRGRIDEVRLYNTPLFTGDINTARQTPLP